MKVLVTLFLICASLELVQSGRLDSLAKYYKTPIEDDYKNILNGTFFSSEQNESENLEQNERYNPFHLSLLNEMGKMVKGILDKTIGKTKEVISKAMGKIKEILSNTAGKTKEVVGEAVGKTKGVIDGTTKTVKSWTKSMLKSAADIGINFLINQFKMLANLVGLGGELNLPNIVTSKFGIKIKATGGHFRSLSSIIKDGEVNITMLKMNSIEFDVPMKFNEMNVCFNNLELKAFLFGSSGNCTIHCGKSALTVKLIFTLGSPCLLNIEDVNIKELGQIDVQFHGFGSFADSIVDKLSGTLIDYVHGTIQNQIEQAINYNLNKVVGDNPLICSKFIPL